VDFRSPPNLLGEHNDYIFGELLGMTQEEIQELEREAFIGSEYVAEIP